MNDIKTIHFKFVYNLKQISNLQVSDNSVGIKLNSINNIKSLFNGKYNEVLIVIIK